MKTSNFIRIFVFLGVCFSAMPSYANQSIRVGIHHFEPLVFADEHGQATGLFVDVLNHIAKKENWQIRYVFGTWQECLDRLDSGEIDLLTGIAFSDERTEKYDFTSEYLFLDWAQVYKRKSAVIETLFDLKGKTVASLKGSVITHDFKNLLEQFGVRCTIVEKDDYNQVAEAVHNKEADAGICMNIRVLRLIKLYDIESTHISFSPKKIRFAVRKGFNEFLLSKLDSYIAALKADKHSVYYEFYDKWTDIYRPKHIVPAWLWGAGLTIICISILLLLFIAILNRQVRIRTSELTKTNEDLRKSEERFRTVADYNYDWEYWIGTDGKFVYVSPSCERITGYRSDEFINDYELLEKIVHPDDRNFLTCYFNNTSDHNNTFSDFRIITKSGEERWINHICHPVYNDNGEWSGRRASNRDITDRKQAEEKLREHTLFLETLFDTIPNPVFYKDTNGRYTGCNKAFSEFIGKEIGEILGKTAYDISPRQMADKFYEKDRELFQHPGKQHYEWRVKDAEGKIKEVLFDKATSRNTEGIVSGLVGVITDITDRKQSEQELKKRENLFSKVLEILPIGLWIADKNGKLITANPAGIRIWGAAPYVGQEEYATFKARRLPSGQEIAPDDWALTKTIKQGITISDELLEIDAFDGQKKIILNYTAPVFGADRSIQGAIVVNQDITERKRAEEMLRESQYRLNLALRSAAMGVWEWDILGNRRYFDERSCRLLGVNPATFTGTAEDFFNVVHPDDRKMLGTMLAMTIESGVLYDPEYRIILSDGIIRHIKAIGSLYRDDAGNPARVSGIVWDITERKQAEAEKAKLEARLRQAQSMEAIGTLAGGIAHDFNNILFPIIGYTEMTLDDIPKESRAYKNLQEVYTAAMRAKYLVGQILTFSRQREHEKMMLKIQPIVKEALNLIRSTLPSTIKIFQNIDPQCAPVICDPTHIHQIIMNLCTNAFHAMQDNGGTLEVTLAEIRLEAKDIFAYPDVTPGTYLKLSVSDTGIGIPKDILEKIFDPFFTTKPVGRGTGLGLSVIHGIVKQMGGHIRVYSEPGKGTAFHVYMPVAETGNIPAPNQTISEEPAPAGIGRILLVDDEEAILTMLEQMLEELGYSVTSCTGSVEALKAFQNKPDSFDLVITDMTMPNMTGAQLARKLIEIRADIPIILCTGFSEQINGKKSEKLGIRAYLMKPVIRSEMAKIIRKVLEKM